MSTAMPIYYHFTRSTLRNGDPIPAVGEWLVFTGRLVPCQSGLHASPDAFDALTYAPGETLHQVELDGVIVPHGDPVDKYAAEKRRIVASIDATPILRLFARRVALDVIHLWDAPPIVKEFLETGDESKRDAAWDAARDAAWGAARGAVWGAAWGAAWDAAWGAVWGAARGAVWDAAWDAASDAARGAAWDAARDAAWGAAWDAAWDAKQKLYRGWFNEMVEDAFAQQNLALADKEQP